MLTTWWVDTNVTIVICTTCWECGLHMGDVVCVDVFEGEKKNKTFMCDFILKACSE